MQQSVVRRHSRNSSIDVIPEGLPYAGHGCGGDGHGQNERKLFTPLF